jgi:hypothetical protein
MVHRVGAALHFYVRVETSIFPKLFLFLVFLEHYEQGPEVK